MMAANKMAQIAALFGKKLGEEFTVRYEDKEKNGNLMNVVYFITM